MKSNFTRLFIGIATLALSSAAVFAQTSVIPSKPAPPGSYDAWEESMKNPVPWLSWGADLRIRNEYMNKAISLNQNALSEQDLFRFRTRIWATVTPLTNVTINGRLAAEPREWMKPAFAGQYRGKEGLEWRYGIADSLNIKMTEMFNQPLTLSVGRQDMMLGDLGDWWLVADGTPLDGSWTLFFDSARLTFDAKDAKTKFDLIYINQAAQAGDRIPTIGSSTGYYLTEQNEQGVIVYASNKSVDNVTLDGYFIYKGDDKVMANGDNANIYTFGAKVTGTPATHLQYSVEGAYQFGNKEDRVSGVTAWRDISAYAGKAKLTYLLKDSLNNQFSLVGEFLSGDKSNTPGQDEMFDVLWGRWPRWSELYIYSYINETSGRIAQMNNLGRIGPMWSVSPMKGMTFSASYNAMFAQQADPTRAITPTAFSYDGNFRGHYLQTVLKHEFNKHIKAHLWAEFVWEGNYYAQQEAMTFLRGEVMFTF